MKEVDELRATGEIPAGRCQWVDVYGLNGTTPLPPTWFNGSKDVHFGFSGKNTYGQRG
jgi:hypothetical protein